MWTRRHILAGLVAFPALSGAALTQSSPKRLVVVLLRGGLDGLAAVPPIGDPHFERIRGTVEGAVPLDGMFALHPALAPLAPLWSAGSLAVVHAAALPYDGRSHFEAQDLLEGGGRTPREMSDGWLGRAAALAGGEAVAVSSKLPLLLRGPVGAASLDPKRDLGLEPDLEAQVEALYAKDPLLGPALAKGLAMRAQVGDPEGGAASGAGQARGIGLALGRLLAPETGPRIAVIDLPGWDTHTAQAGTLERQLGGLADAIHALKAGLGNAWAETAVVALTEFGRRVALNGTGGTDHGVGGVALLAGGAVRGGRVIADWPSLAPAALTEGRDLKPTIDLRSLEKAICIEHLGLDPAQVNRDVFPGSSSITALPTVFG